MLMENLYQGKGVPEGTKPEVVRQLLSHLVEKMADEMCKEHIWLTIIPTAVLAGLWRGNRLARRRVKLAGIINECLMYIGAEPIEWPEGYEKKGLYYDWWAIEKYCRVRNVDVRDIFWPHQR